MPIPRKDPAAKLEKRIKKLQRKLSEIEKKKKETQTKIQKRGGRSRKRKLKEERQETDESWGERHYEGEQDSDTCQKLEGKLRELEKEKKELEEQTQRKIRKKQKLKRKLREIIKVMKELQTKFGRLRQEMAEQQRKIGKRQKLEEEKQTETHEPKEERQETETQETDPSWLERCYDRGEREEFYQNDSDTYLPSASSGGPTIVKTMCHDQDTIQPSIEEICRVAIKDYNKKHLGDFKYLAINKVKRCPDGFGSELFITLSVTDRGIPKIMRVRAWRCPMKHMLKVELYGCFLKKTKEEMETDAESTRNEERTDEDEERLGTDWLSRLVWEYSEDDEKYYDSDNFLPLARSHPPIYERCPNYEDLKEPSIEDICDIAIQDYNQRHAKVLKYLRTMKVKWSHYGCGHFFFVTLEVNDQEKTKIMHVRAWRNSLMGQPSVVMFGCF